MYGYRRDRQYRNPVEKSNAEKRYYGSKSRNVREGRKYQKKVENLPINHPNGGKAIGDVNNVMMPEKVYLNPSAYKVSPTVLPQREVTDINIPIYVPAFEDLGSTVGLIAQAMGITPLETTLWYNQSIGSCYLFKVCVLFDLWYALFGQYSIVTTAPKWYWDLRSAILPTRRGKFSYKWVVPETFIGTAESMFPTGVPMTCGDETGVNLSWLGDYTQPNAVLNNIMPNITDLQLVDSAGEIMTIFFTAMERLSPLSKMINKDDPTAASTNPYFRSVAAFTSNVPLYSPLSPEDRWANFTMEVPINDNEKWLACLGLPDGRRALSDDMNATWVRTGTVTFNEMLTSNYLAYYILNGNRDTLRHTALRTKQLSLESIMWSITTTLVQGDMLYNEKAGTNSIDNTTWLRSVMKNLSPNYLIQALAPVLRKWIMYNNCYWNNLNTDAYSIAGSKYYVGGSLTTVPVPRMIGETLADLSPIRFSKKREDYFLVCVLTAAGNFGVDPTQDGNGLMGDLTNLVRAMFPGVTATSYQLQAIHPGFTYFDVSDMYKCNFVGTLATEGASAIAEVYAALQGNIDLMPGSSHVNDSTLMYYTDVLKYPQDDIIVMEGNDKPMKKKGGSTRVGITNWTKLYDASTHSLVNSFPFTQNQVSYDLTRLRTYTVSDPIWFAAIYKTNYALTYSRGEVNLYRQLVIDSAKVYAHPLSTIGGMEQNQMLVDATTQNIGGGFSLIGDLVKGIPFVGDLVSKLLG